MVNFCSYKGSNSLQPTGAPCQNLVNGTSAASRPSTVTQSTCNLHQTFQPLSSQLQPRAASSHVGNMVKFELNSQNSIFTMATIIRKCLTNNFIQLFPDTWLQGRDLHFFQPCLQCISQKLVINTPNLSFMLTNIIAILT